MSALKLEVPELLLGLQMSYATVALPTSMSFSLNLLATNTALGAFHPAIHNG